LFGELSLELWISFLGSQALKLQCVFYVFSQEFHGVETIFLAGSPPFLSVLVPMIGVLPSAFHKVNPRGELRFWTILQFPAFYSLGELEPY
jgi:hypothetical protein